MYGQRPGVTCEELTEAEREYESLWKLIQEKLVKFIRRVTIFMYRHHTEKDAKVGISNAMDDPGNADSAITVGATHRDSPSTYGGS